MSLGVWARVGTGLVLGAALGWYLWDRPRRRTR